WPSMAMVYAALSLTRPAANHQSRQWLGDEWFVAGVSSSLSRNCIMDAFFVSTVAVAIAEMGDKTQLLALFLITRFKKPWPIVAGILVATLLNHGASAWLGDWLGALLENGVLDWLLGLSFLLMAAWLLIPDKDEETDSRFLLYGAFWATLILFFLAEIGDKTQVATVLLAARFDNMLSVIVGTTLGMLVANVPVIWGGQWLMTRINIIWVTRMAAAVFALLGVVTLVNAGLG
ncbi:MAG: TMEM165/GDT1 family protein, partial [Natronospirillum sp.]